MVNVAVAIEHGIEKVGEDIADVITGAEKVEKVIATLIENESAFKTVLISEVSQMVSLASQVAKVVSEKGLAFSDDETLMSSIQTFFAGIKTTFIPEVEKIYGEISTDVITPVTTVSISGS